MSKQDRVIWYLTSQLIRHKFLTVQYLKERQHHNETADIVASLARDFDQIATSQETRLQYLQTSPALSSQKFPKRQNDAILFAISALIQQGMSIGQRLNNSEEIILEIQW
jgi:hypothetical protein